MKLIFILVKINASGLPIGRTCFEIIFIIIHELLKSSDQVKHIKHKVER